MTEIKGLDELMEDRYMNVSYESNGVQCTQTLDINGVYRLMIEQNMGFYILDDDRVCRFYVKTDDSWYQN